MSSKTADILFFTGNSNPELARRIAEKLQIPLSPTIADTFSNGERRIQLKSNVRGKHVFLLQTGLTDSDGSTNDYLFELLLMINAAKLSDAKTVTVLYPHYPYSRQDKKDRSRTPISARLVAEMLQVAGATRLVTVDLHSSQIQGFFSIPVDNLFARDYLIQHLCDYVFAGLNQDEIRQKFVLVSPDAGGTKRVMKMAQKMELRSVLMHKQRDHSRKNHVESTLIVGEDDCVRGKTCIIVDDMTDTFGTVVKACDTLVEHGALEVIVCITHGILSGPAIDRLNDCTAVSKLITSNTIPQNMDKSKKIQVFDLSPLLATCVDRIANGGSISELFHE